MQPDQASRPRSRARARCHRRFYLLFRLAQRNTKVTPHPPRRKRKVRFVPKDGIQSGRTNWSHPSFHAIMRRVLQRAMSTATRLSSRGQALAAGGGAAAGITNDFGTSDNLDDSQA